jgi:phenylalanyl-tRNA synthetase beta chain
MICGADEIGLSKETSGGIMILEEHWERHFLESRIGTSVYDLTLPFPGHDGTIYEYPLGDIVFEIDNKFITNRPDLFSVIGNAREFHAVFDTDLIPYIPKNIDIQTQELKVEILTDKVLSYHLIQMDHLSIGQSPFSIALMMERAGLPVKMDIVDITNLIMTEL